MADQSEANPVGGDEDRVTITGADDAPNGNDNLDREAGEDFDPDNPDNETGAANDDTEEVELDGAKYRVPTALKDKFLMHADYTRKTMEIGEERKTIASEKAAQAAEAEKVVERLKAVDVLQKQFDETASERLELKAIDDEIAIYGKMTQAEWQDLAQRDPSGFNAHQARYTNLRLDRGLHAEKLATKVQAFDAEKRRLTDEAALEVQRETAKRLEEGRAVLARDIPNWGPEVRGKLVSYGQTQGFSAEEIGAVSDPRLIKLLHLAMTGSQSSQQRRTAENVRAATAIQPAKTVSVGGNAPPKPKLDEIKDVDAWMRRRNAEVRKRG